MYYTYTDHLGSIVTITNDDGTELLEEQSFDPWGRRRNPADWDDYSNIPAFNLLDRGYTGHEHLPQFGLINMNGRLCDPILGRMLSPDKFVGFPGLTQSYNRYSYVLNNPLKYTDPDGEWIQALSILAHAYLGGVQANGFQFDPGQWNWKNPGTYIGILQGGASGYYEGGALQQDFNNIFGNSNTLLTEFANSPPYGFNPYLAASSGRGSLFEPVGKTAIPTDNIDFFARKYDLDVYAFSTFKSRSLFSKIWNSDFIRGAIKDRYTLKFNYNFSPALGIGQSLDFHLMTRGPEPGFFITNSVSQKFIPEVDAGIEFGYSRFNGPVSEMTRKSVEDRYYDIDFGGIYGGSVYVSFDKNDEIWWYGASAGVGVTYGVSFGVGMTRMGFSTYPKLY